MKRQQEDVLINSSRVELDKGLKMLSPPFLQPMGPVGGIGT